jgi:hypothetical protein
MLSPGAGIFTDEAERARHIAQIIQNALGQPPAGNFTVTSQGGCTSCDPGSCPECGYLFTGDRITIAHKTKGNRTISDKALHYLSHGVTCYQTNYVVQGMPVTVELNLDELASYLDLYNART